MLSLGVRPHGPVGADSRRNKFAFLKFPVGSCNINSFELLDLKFLSVLCSHLQHASCPKEDKPQEMHAQRGCGGMATALSCICLVRSATDHIHGGQDSEDAPSAARGRYCFPRTPHVTGSSGMFPY